MLAMARVDLIFEMVVMHCEIFGFLFGVYVIVDLAHRVHKIHDLMSF